MSKVTVQKTSKIWKFTRLGWKILFVLSALLTLEGVAQNIARNTALGVAGMILGLVLVLLARVGKWFSND